MPNRDKFALLITTVKKVKRKKTKYFKKLNKIFSKINSPARSAFMESQTLQLKSS